MKSTIFLGWMFLGLVCLLPTTGIAGDDVEELPRLTVAAEGKMDVAPDKAVLSFSVETAGAQLEKVQRQNQERMARVLEECRALNIPSSNIQTTSLNVIPEYPPSPRHSMGNSSEPQIPRIIGYRVRHQVNVEIHNLTIVGQVVDRVLKAGANRFSGISWGLQDAQPYKLQVLQLAASKARAKAETLAQSLHLTLVRVMKVREGGVLIVAPERQYRMASASLAMDSGSDVSISAGEIAVQGSVTLVYEIAPK